MHQPNKYFEKFETDVSATLLWPSSVRIQTMRTTKYSNRKGWGKKVVTQPLSVAVFKLVLSACFVCIFTDEGHCILVYSGRNVCFKLLEIFIRLVCELIHWHGNRILQKHANFICLVWYCLGNSCSRLACLTSYY